jgi:hypothetical protein
MQSVELSAQRNSASLEKDNEMMFECGIYKIENTQTGDFYIGSSFELDAREWSHFNKFKRGKHTKKLKAAWEAEADKSVFKFTIVFYCRREDLEFFEQRSLDVYQPAYNARKKTARGEKPKNHGELTSQGLATFWVSPEGERSKKERGENQKLFYQTDEGLQAAKEISLRVTEDWSGEKGDERRITQGAKVSKSKKAYHQTDEGTLATKQQGERLSAWYDDTEEGRAKAKEISERESKSKTEYFKTERGIAQAKEHSLRVSGLNAPRCTITAEQLKGIREATGTTAHIARLFNVTWGVVDGIRKGRTYKQ